MIDPTTQDLAKTTQAILPAGVDYAFDNTGRPATIEAATSVLGKRGVLGMVGVPANQESAISLNIGYVVGRGVGIRGIVEGDSDPDTFIPTLINHYRNGELPFDRLIQTYPLSDINLAVNDQVSGQTVKAVLLTAAAIV